MKNGVAKWSCYKYAWVFALKGKMTDPQPQFEIHVNFYVLCLCVVHYA